MDLHINGEIVELPKTIETVVDLIEHFKLDQKVIIVEVNGVILEKVHHQDTKLSDGDKIEIVHFVGGG